MIFDNVPCDGKAPRRTEAQVTAMHRKLLNLFVSTRPFSFLAEPITALLRSIFACNATYSCSLTRDGFRILTANGALKHIQGETVVIGASQMRMLLNNEKARFLRAEKLPTTFKQNTTHSNLHSLIEATITMSGRCYGIIGASDSNPDFFNEEDAKFLQDTADFIGILVEKRDVAYADDERMHLRRSGFVYERFYKIIQANTVDLLRALGNLKTMASEKSNNSAQIVLSGCFQNIENLASCTQDMRELVELCAPVVEQGAECRIWEILDCVCDYLKVQIDNVATLVKLKDEELPAVFANFSSLWQVFHAVVQNAIAAIQNAHPSPDHTITIDGFTLGSQIIIKVSDTGCGILESDIKNAFIPFYTTSPKLNRGIGLTKARNYVTSLGGKIQLLHNEPQGTVALIILPIIDRKPPSDIF